MNLGTQRILPGKTYITLKEHAADCKYLYIRNQSGVWQKLEGLSDGTFAVSSTGRYLLTRHRMDWHRPDPVWILCGFGVLTAAVLIYIVSKKRYWFW